jgi:CBS domain-containing protein
MVPKSEAEPLDPELEAADALRLMAGSETDELPVLENGKFLGLLRKRDVLRWLSLHLDPADSRL